MEGLYFDPKHGNCLRRIEPLGRDEYRIRGVYGVDEEHVGDPWTAVARRSTDGLAVDFAGKVTRSRRFLHAWPCPNAYSRLNDLCWEDGNRWTRLRSHEFQTCASDL